MQHKGKNDALFQTGATSVFRDRTSPPQAISVRRRTFLKSVSLAGGALGLSGVVRLGQRAGWAAHRPLSSEEKLLATAEERIEQHRKADATVEVLSAGKPVPALAVQIEQIRHRFLFGCNVFLWQPMNPERLEDPQSQWQKAYRERFAGLFNYATLPFYWWAYEPQAGQPRHALTEQMARWCQQHHIVAKGHPLAWNWGEPRWLPDNAEEVIRLQLARIEDCVQRFVELIDYWDVVNEAVAFDREKCRRQAPRLTAAWAKLGRVEFTRKCLQQARGASQKAFLLVNDYIVDPRYEKLLEELKGQDGRLPIQAIGIQSHQHGGPWPSQKIWEVCERFSRFGIPLHFTETTILSGRQGWQLPPDQWASTPEGERWQAEQVVRFYTLLFSHPAVQAITWWDLSDRGAWQNAPAGLIRKDMSPKPAYEELHRRIKGQWWTRAEAKTNQAGLVQWRGFLGQYRLQVTLEGRQIEKTVELTPDGQNRFVWELNPS